MTIFFQHHHILLIFVAIIVITFLVLCMIDACMDKSIWSFFALDALFDALSDFIGFLFDIFN